MYNGENNPMQDFTINEIDFKFCPHCGAAFHKRSARDLECISCGLDFYVSPKPCNAIIIENKQREILFVKRGVEPAKGLWDLPGGFVDIGESAEESVIREAKEELGVRVTKVRYLFSGCDRYMFKGINYYTLGLIFTAQIADGTLAPHDDVASLQYFSMDNIPWECLAFPALENTLKKYLQQR